MTHPPPRPIFAGDCAATISHEGRSASKFMEWNVDPSHEGGSEEGCFSELAVANRRI